MLKKNIQINLRYFFFFYKYLKYGIFIAMFLSVIAGIMDGFGLALIIPLLTTILNPTEGEVQNEVLGELDFLVSFFSDLGYTIDAKFILILMLFFFFSKGFLLFLERYYAVILRINFVQKLRFELIDRFERYSFAAFTRNDFGKIQNSTTGEVNVVIAGYNAYFSAIKAGIFSLVFISLAIWTNVLFSILILFNVLMVQIVYLKLYAWTKSLSLSFTKNSNAFAGFLLQSVINFKYLKATSMFSFYSQKLKTIILNNQKIVRKMGLLSAIISASREPLIFSIIVFIIYTYMNFFEGDPSNIVLSLIFFYRSLTNLMVFQNQWNSFMAKTGSIENTLTFIEELQTNEEVDRGKDFRELQTIHFEDFSFQYPQSDKLVLKDIHLSIAKNQTIAFIGQSGAGKTTIVNILTGLFRDFQGKILLNGTSLKEFNFQSVQSNIGYITQEPSIFSDTLFNNITFWAEKNKVNLAKFYEVCKKVALDDFVNAQKEKEDIMLGDSGLLVSGGQRQRISIARELYKNPAILIMDEATSSLDSETESFIQKSIDDLKGSYTIIIIAHRLSTIKKADNIVLLNNGSIEDQGTFEELREKNQKFSKMVELQNLD